MFARTVDDFVYVDVRVLTIGLLLELNMLSNKLELNASSRSHFLVVEIRPGRLLTSNLFNGSLDKRY